MADDGMECELPPLPVTTTLPPPSQQHGSQEEQRPQAQAVVHDDGDSDYDDDDMEMGGLLLDDDSDYFIPLGLDDMGHLGDEPPSFARIPLEALRQVAAARQRFRMTHAPVTIPHGEGGGYSNGGFGAVPASAAAVSGLEKQEFQAGRGRDGAAEGSGAAATGCMICFEEFTDGEAVSVIPCARGHEFHTQCIDKWLAASNMCPLCRHKLPAAPMA